MRELAYKEKDSPRVREALRKATGIPNPPATLETAREVYYWVRSNITFVPDEVLLQRMGERPDKELLFDAPALLSMRNPVGDCDDFSLLLATMLLSIGMDDLYFVTLAVDPHTPERWSHIYLSKGNLALDASHGHYPGWEAPNYFRKRYWKV